MEKVEFKNKLKLNLLSTKIEPLDHCVLWYDFVTSNYFTLQESGVLLVPCCVRQDLILTLNP